MEQHGELEQDGELELGLLGEGSRPAASYVPNAGQMKPLFDL